MFKFFITNIHINHGVLTHNLVYARFPGEEKEHYLSFNTYELAERWIADERESGARHLYQIQKIYIAQ